jgi:DNA-binding LytR/AlgR family response regulator
MYNIGICDDDKILCSEIEQWILNRSMHDFENIETDVFLSGEDLLKHLELGKTLDLLFLDIELGKINGVEAGRYIRKNLSNETMHIVYISAKQGYAMDLFDNRPLNFLVKPLKKEKLFESIDMAMKLSNISNSCFEFQFKGKHSKVLFKDIIYFYSENRKIKVKLRVNDFEFYGKIADLINQVPASCFIQIHKSYLVNSDHIVDYVYSSIMMTNGENLSISQPNRKAVREYLFEKRKSK